MPAGEFILGIDNFPYLALFGFLVGALGGFFGVGGGFLMVPMLNVVFGVPYNIAVGSDLGQMCGMSTAATVRHVRFGNIDFKLGVLMIAGTATGVEVGAQVLEALKHVGAMTILGREIDAMTVVMSVVYAALLIFLAPRPELLDDQRREGVGEPAAGSGRGRSSSLREPGRSGTVRGNERR